MIRFKTLDEVYLLPIQNSKYFGRDIKIILKVYNSWWNTKNGYHIPYQYQPRLDYLKAVDKLILDESEDRVWRKTKGSSQPKKNGNNGGKSNSKRIEMWRERLLRLLASWLLHFRCSFTRYLIVCLLCLESTCFYRS